MDRLSSHDVAARACKKPEMIYSDEERAIASSESTPLELTLIPQKDLFEPFRLCYLAKRIEADERKGKRNVQWTGCIHQIMLTYVIIQKQKGSLCHQDDTV